MRHLLPLCALLGLSGCSLYLPTRFADRPPAQHVLDDLPIPVPEHRDLLEAVRWSDIYLRRPLVRALDPSRPLRAGDVNAVDEVPISSWFEPLEAEALSDAWWGEGPPEPPLKLIGGKPDIQGDAVRVLDARGIGYELVVDPRQAPDTATAAGPITARLLQAIGYRVAPAHRIAFERSQIEGGDTRNKLFQKDIDRRIFLATEWPLGIDIGLTAPRGRRPDDPNDRVPHENRRTLRALLPIASWLDIGGVGTGYTRDAYVGQPGKGHVQHFYTRSSPGLGSQRALSGKPYESAAGVVAGSPLQNLLTLGLNSSGSDERHPTDPRLLIAAPDAGDFVISTPYEPFDELRPDDVYWATKRIASISDQTLVRAIQGSGQPLAEQQRLNTTLRERVLQLVDVCLRLVTPIEYEGVSEGRLIVRDFASFRFGNKPVAHNVWLHDARGRLLAHSQLAPAPRSLLTIPRAIGLDYLVVRIQALRSPAPRPAELHFRLSPNPRLVGVIH